MTTPLLPYLLLLTKSGLTTFCNELILLKNCLKVKKKLHKIYAVLKIYGICVPISSFVHVLLLLAVYQTGIQVNLQYKAFHLLVTHVVQVETLVGTM